MILPWHKNMKKCPVCETGNIVLKHGKYGAFYGCSRFPECKYHHGMHKPWPNRVDATDDWPENAFDELDQYGIDPMTGCLYD